MKRRAGEREKELKVPSVCFLLPAAPRSVPVASPLSVARGVVRGRAPRGSGSSSARGLRGRREVHCEEEGAPAPGSVPRSQSRG